MQNSVFLVQDSLIPCFPLMLTAAFGQMCIIHTDRATSEGDTSCTIEYDYHNRISTTGIEKHNINFNSEME